MTRRISLNARDVTQAGNSAAVEVVLMEFTHADLSAPVRLSTDATERLTDVPRTYGTRSTWRGANPATQPFLFAPVELELPGDMADTAPEARLVLSSVGVSLVTALRSFTTRATCHMALVMSNAPNVVDVSFPAFVVIGASLTGSQIEITLVSDPVELEAFPSPRMTQQRLPGAFA